MEKNEAKNPTNNEVKKTPNFLSSNETGGGGKMEVGKGNVDNTNMGLLTNEQREQLKMLGWEENEISNLVKLGEEKQKNVIELLGRIGYLSSEKEAGALTIGKEEKLIEYRSSLMEIQNDVKQVERVEKVNNKAKKILNNNNIEEVNDKAKKTLNSKNQPTENIETQLNNNIDRCIKAINENLSTKFVWTNTSNNSTNTSNNSFNGVYQRLFLIGSDNKREVALKNGFEFYKTTVNETLQRAISGLVQNIGTLRDKYKPTSNQDNPNNLNNQDNSNNPEKRSLADRAQLLDALLDIQDILNKKVCEVNELEGKIFSTDGINIFKKKYGESTNISSAKNSDGTRELETKLNNKTQSITIIKNSNGTYSIKGLSNTLFVVPKGKNMSTADYLESVLGLANFINKVKILWEDNDKSKDKVIYKEKEGKIIYEKENDLLNSAVNVWANVMAIVSLPTAFGSLGVAYLANDANKGKKEEEKKIILSKGDPFFSYAPQFNDQRNLESLARFIATVLKENFEIAMEAQLNQLDQNNAIA